MTIEAPSTFTGAGNMPGTLLVLLIVKMVKLKHRLVGLMFKLVLSKAEIQIAR